MALDNNKIYCWREKWQRCRHRQSHGDDDDGGDDESDADEDEEAQKMKKASTKQNTLIHCVSLSVPVSNVEYTLAEHTHIYRMGVMTSECECATDEIQPSEDKPEKIAIKFIV